MITYTIQEPSTKNDPFYLQNLMYDLPFETKTLDSLTIKITIPKNLSTFIIDDLHFVKTTHNTIEFILEEGSQLMYQLFVANHELCNLCERKALYDCQKLPVTFEKTIDVVLTQPNAQAYLKCHYLGDQTSALKITTNQQHLASDTTSKLMVKGVLDDEARIVSDNLITIPKGMKNVVAEQMNNNLMLSRTAHAVSIPKLAVESQHVACKHGATISSIDQEQLFYLQSRGISKIDAERTLVDAFLG